MRVERIHRWQWVIIALVVGFLIGYVRNLFTAEDISGYGNSMNGQQQFENAILTHERLPNGEARPLFYKLTVISIKDPNPQRLSQEDTLKQLTPAQKKQYDSIKRQSDQQAYLREVEADLAGSRRTYAIAGVYYNGRPSQNPKTKQWEKVWHPYFYIAPSQYKPSKEHTISGSVPPLKLTFTDKLQTAAEKLHLKAADPPDSVLAYLKALKAQGRVDFNYEWWRAPRVSMAIWIGVCLIVIGGIWPTLINLLVYGTLTRPYEEKVDLSKVRSAQSAKASRGPTEEDLAQLKALEEQLEAQLAASASSRPMGPSDQPAPAPVKQLTAKELEVAAAARAQEAHEYAAKPDDFYPTEKRIKHKDEH
ncbi:MAG TPA: hypothetical protein VGP99_13190 [Tepidisphaeraceae bacterium]|nr:hypothetical protein [Tepidisphaeraceae bacterium]